MSNSDSILVVSDRTEDGESVGQLLRVEFEKTFVCADAKRYVQDFELYKPAVLVLAFSTVQKAERYLQSLQRPATLAQALAHRVLALCGKDDLARAYELCKLQVCDDYLLFWPTTEDPQRLRLAVHQALRQVADERAGLPSTREFAAQARRLAGLDDLLTQHLVQGAQSIDHVHYALEEAQRDIESALEGAARRLAPGETAGAAPERDRAALRQEIARHFAAVAAAAQPARERLARLKEELAPQLAAARALQALAERRRPLILVVDDDKFQHKLLAQILQEADAEVSFAASATEGLASLHRHRPDLVLMDVGLPDIDGVAATRLMKSAAHFAAIPVVMITGVGARETVVESLKAGAADFLVKPIDKAILLGKVRKLLTGAAPA